MRRLRLNSLKNRLVLLFFVITAAAIAFVYLYVVPQLQSSLTADKLRRLASQASEHTPALARAEQRGDSEAALRLLARSIAQRTSSRVTVLGVRDSGAGPVPAFVIADSELEATAARPRYEVAANAAATGRVSSAVESVGGQRLGETAVPISAHGAAQWVAVFSDTLGDVDDTVALIQRQILIAGIIALVAALVAGYYAARAISRRLRRLEAAAEQVAEGDFATPIPVDSSDELGQLAMTFNEMQRRLAQLDSAQKEFIANASHELRTPIFSLGGFVELLEHDDPDDASRDEFVRTMRGQVDRLTKLTADLLDLSKLDAGAMEVSSERVALGELAGTILDEFGPAAERHRSSLQLESEPTAVAAADPGRVGQIMRILLDNALRHTPEGTAVTVTAAKQNGAAQLRVADDGPGIDHRPAERVFERFHTGDSVTGSGLGLAIAHELAERMHGHLEVASQRGSTTFTLELPDAEPSGAGA